MQAAILEGFNKWPKPDTFKPQYGTAGFRAEAHLLHSTMFRCGILMAIRAMKTKQVTGICITASHNPAADNGVKLVEPTGEMLQQRYEPIADELANAPSADDLASLVTDLLQKEGITLDGATGTVFIAYDTRPSGPELAEAAAAGVHALGIQTKLIGLLTTPQLHWIVMRTNQGEPATEQDYYNTLSTAFEKLAGKASPPHALYVDCAHGVGGQKLALLAPLLEQGAGLQLHLRNTGDGVLNSGCGSDYIQKDRIAPEGFADVPPGSRCCAVDGDADRLVYFIAPSASNDGAVQHVMLLDGDKIAALAAGLLKDLVSKLPGDLSTRTTVGIVQTAYANGSSSKYLTETLHCEVAVTPTGVKYLHEAAHAFDIGIYFEANGHGTVLFRSSFLESLKSVADESDAAKELLAVDGVINAAVGDAISGILLVEAALRKKEWSLNDWAALYTDLPSRQLKVKVADRSVITTTDAERKVSSPEGLQQRIDEAVAGVPSGRSFVRPSGTEDVVRVYAEAKDQELTDSLAKEVAKIVYKYAGGVGEEP